MIDILGRLIEMVHLHLMIYHYTLISLYLNFNQEQNLITPIVKSNYRGIHKQVLLGKL